MAKFYGTVGYGHSVDRQNGTWSDDITEKKHYGDVKRNTRRLVQTQEANDDITVGNTISILADAYAEENFFAIRYVEWAGALWTVSNIVVQRPRLILELGGVYTGPRPTPAPIAPGGASG